MGEIGRAHPLQSPRIILMLLALKLLRALLLPVPSAPHHMGLTEGADYLLSSQGRSGGLGAGTERAAGHPGLLSTLQLPVTSVSTARGDQGVSQTQGRSPKPCKPATLPGT